MSDKNLTADRLRELLDYDADTGLFRWIKTTSPRVKVGSVAGGKNSDGYVQIQIDGKLYTAHRLALMWADGRWPLCSEVDHINGDRSDNRIVNLRKTDRSGNQQNVSSARGHSKTGLLGVSVVRGGYTAFINTRGTKRYLGFFKTPQAAHGAYLAAKREMHAGCTI